jgi:hypothetical protein
VSDFRQFIAEHESAGDDSTTDWLSPAEVLRLSPIAKARFSTGLPMLDTATGGGVPTGSVVVYQGEPDGGKTGLALQLGLKWAIEQDIVLSCYLPDGGREAASLRIGGYLGLDVKKLDARDQDEIGILDGMLADRRIFLPDPWREDTSLTRFRAHAESICADLPHVYIVDSAQESAPEDARDEHLGVKAVMQWAARIATSSSIPSIVLLTSQISVAAFGAKKPSDNRRAIAAAYGSVKVGFLAHLIVHLTGDPGRGPDYGRMEVIKSKMGVKKPPAAGLRVLDDGTGRLAEIDAGILVEQRDERKSRAEVEASLRMQKPIENAINSKKPRKGYPGLTGNQLTRACGVGRSNLVFWRAIRALTEGQSWLEEIEGPNRSTCYRRKQP